jgi:hypothetical protein
MSYAFVQVSATVCPSVKPLGLLAVQLKIGVPGGCSITSSTSVIPMLATVAVQFPFGQPASAAVAVGRHGRRTDGRQGHAPVLAATAPTSAATARNRFFRRMSLPPWSSDSPFWVTFVRQERHGAKGASRRQIANNIGANCGLRDASCEGRSPRAHLYRWRPAGGLASRGPPRRPPAVN